MYSEQWSHRPGFRVFLNLCLMACPMPRGVLGDLGTWRDWEEWEEESREASKGLGEGSGEGVESAAVVEAERSSGVALDSESAACRGARRTEEDREAMARETPLPKPEEDDATLPPSPEAATSSLILAMAADMLTPAPEERECCSPPDVAEGATDEALLAEDDT